MATDDQIDRLYQIGLEAFIAERNALAKTSRHAALKALPKPSVPAWAVNQIYWHERAIFDRLVQAAEARRHAHRRALAGEAADIQAAEATHRDAVREALAAARKVLETAGHPVTPATVESVTRTLEALPSPEANGRLVRPLTPAGFEALAGLAPAPSPSRATLRVVSSRDAPRPPADAPAVPVPRESERARARAEAEREAQARAERAAREREAREEERRAAEQVLATAREDLHRADAAVAEAELALDTRRAERETARASVRRATRDLERL